MHVVKSFVSAATYQTKGACIDVMKVGAVLLTVVMLWSSAGPGGAGYAAR